MKHQRLNRRNFMRDTAVVGAGAITSTNLLTTLKAFAPGASAAQSAVAPTTALDVAEWSFFWVGVERAELAKGPVVSGKQMYVEYQIPTQVRHPYPIVLVHAAGLVAAHGRTLCWATIWCRRL